MDVLRLNTPTRRRARARGRRAPVRVPLSRSRQEALSTNLWVVPTLMVTLVAGLFVLTLHFDVEAARGQITLPSWISSGGPDAARQTLIAIAAAVITVAGVVFSITILVLQLASQQFGPRMLRNFIRDRGTQVSLGAFVATFVYSTVALASVSDAPNLFVPHLSATVAEALALIDLVVLIYFIDHVAKSIQLTSVVSGIARDFRTVLANSQADAWQAADEPFEHVDRSRLALATEGGIAVAAAASGFLQAVGQAHLVAIATSSDAVIRLLYRPGHFLVAGQPLALVAPPEAAEHVAKALTRAHIVGPNRTLTQDPGFAIDQLVEVAIRALSPAVNDTFTALNCIDWLADCLCRAYARPLPSGLYRDSAGALRLIEPAISHERLLKGATDKIRQAGRGMPAVLIRQLEGLRKVMVVVSTRAEREVVLHHAEMILRTSDGSVAEESDRNDVHAAYDLLLATASESWDS
ncbi:MAG: DUF2254 domain-containing protein [Chloroflexi bacterium]|nr:DUF2254 domain-containing protein [Chloroflexota bacterium]